MSTLWPEFGKEAVGRTPASVLKEQGLELGKQFNNKILGDVHVEQTQDKNMFVCTFYVRCPPLNYSFRLLRLGFKFLDIYPAQITPDAEVAQELYGGEKSGISVDDEDALQAELQRVFASKKATKVIAALRQHLG